MTNGASKRVVQEKVKLMRKLRIQQKKLRLVHMRGTCKVSRGDLGVEGCYRSTTEVGGSYLSRQEALFENRPLRALGQFLSLPALGTIVARGMQGVTPCT
jgi:hypothetical protein